MDFKEHFTEMYKTAENASFNVNELELFYNFGKQDALEAEDKAEEKIKALIKKLEGVLNESN